MESSLIFRRYLSFTVKESHNHCLLRNKIHTYIPAVKWDLWRNHMSTVLANEEFDSIIEESRSVLREERLALLNEVKWIWWALTEGTYITVALLTTIRVYTVGQTIWKKIFFWNLASRETALFKTCTNGEKCRIQTKVTVYVLSLGFIKFACFSWKITLSLDGTHCFAHKSFFPEFSSVYGLCHIVYVWVESSIRYHSL